MTVAWAASAVKPRARQPWGRIERGAEKAHRAGIGHKRLDGELPGVVGKDGGEERHRGHGRVVQERADPRREARQQDVDAHVGARGEGEREGPDPAHGQGIAAELVGGAGRNADEAAAEDVERDVERPDEEHGAGKVGHTDGYPVEQHEDAAQEREQARAGPATSHAGCGWRAQRGIRATVTAG